MSRLFIELYFDEDVHILVADLIKARGFEALTTRDARQLQNSDPQQLAYAVSQQKTLVTHNRVDFEQEKKHYGIIFAVRHSLLSRRISAAIERRQLTTNKQNDFL